MINAAMACHRCSSVVQQIVRCDCFGQFCRLCFSKHSCGREHLACWSGAPRGPDLEPQTLDPRMLAEALPLRDVQEEFADGVRQALTTCSRTLAVAGTGFGKTVVCGHIARRWKRGRVLFVAHRDELIRQAADKLGRIVGEEVDIEMGVRYADTNLLEAPAKVVVTSVQTMCREKRHARFNPTDFGLLIIDEAHHAVAKTYRRIIDYFAAGNPAIKILGVTATPDRHDEQALGKIFESVAFEYGILQAINDGWSVPIEQQFVFVEGLDFSRCRTAGGDLNGRDLAAVMEAEDTLHRVVSPTLELAGDQQTLVFAASVQHAERMAEIANRHRPGCAEIVHGGTQIERRRDILDRFSRREFQFLFNCMIATEGFDEPSIGVVAIARPTKSRALYAQMVGRGTRPLTGSVDNLPDASSRRDAIRCSSKPSLLVLDFAGNAGRHKLVNVADILGGDYDDNVVERARAEASRKSRDGQKTDVAEELAAAQEREEEERRRRSHVLAKADFRTKQISPFELLDITPRRESGCHKGRKPTPRQLETLHKFRVDPRDIDQLSFFRASQLIDHLIKRSKAGLCTPKQAALLDRFGYPTDVTFEAASEIIDSIAQNGWQRPV